MTNNRAFVMVAVLLPVCFLLACGELVEPASPNLVSLLSGSPGYEGDGEVLGLRTDTLYLVRHEKEKVFQEQNPVGEIRMWHDEDWYAVNSSGSIVKIGSSSDDIPGRLDINAKLPGTSISGFTNGERYNVYFYGELTSGERLGRTYELTPKPQLATFVYNTVVNLRRLGPNQQINVWEEDEDTGNRAGPLHPTANHLIVLVNTPLYWTEYPQTLIGVAGATIRVRGYDYDIEIQSKYARDLATVAPIEKDGQKYFILTGTYSYRGYIKIVEKE